MKTGSADQGGGASQALERPAATAVAAEVMPPGSSPEHEINDPTGRLKDAARDVELKKRKGGRTRQGQDFYFDYMTGEQVMDLLDEETPGWDFKVKSITSLTNEKNIAKPEQEPRFAPELCIYAVGSLTIDGITREGVGTGLVRPDCPLETAIKKADTDSLKRAAAKFGVGVARLKAEAAISYAAEGQAVRQGGTQRTQRANPRASGAADLITRPQKVRIGELSQALGHGREWVEEKVGCKAEEMSKAAASSLINVMEQELAVSRATALLLKRKAQTAKAHSLDNCGPATVTI